MKKTADMIEKYLDRDLEIGDKTEYYTLSSRRKQFWVKAPPIITLTDVYVDLEGLYTGRESIIPYCFPDEFLSSVRFPYAYWMEWTGVKSIRVRYNGGLASHAVNNSFTIPTGYTGTWAVGSYVSGGTSGAVGIVTAVVAPSPSFDATLTVETYYGVFTAGETLTQTTAEGTGTATASGRLLTINDTSLVNAAPEIVMACDSQIRYMWKHTTDFENVGSQKDGTTTRAPILANHEWPLTPEVREMLNPYRRVAVM